jgi:hypothetical protein
MLAMLSLLFLYLYFSVLIITYSMYAFTQNSKASLAQSSLVNLSTISTTSSSFERSNSSKGFHRAL